MKTAAAYIRVSTEDQLEYSPDSQIKMIRDYAERNGYSLKDEYIFADEGISGRAALKRPAFIRMIGIAKTKPKPFDAILLWKFSRFARSREDSIVYKSMLRKQLGIDVISVSENLGDDKMSVLIEAMIEAMDEYYSINLAEEVRRGMTEKAKRGEPLSIPPFGYKMEGGKLAVIKEEGDVIKQVFEWYLGGMGMLTIAKKLNAMGVRTHRGNMIENRTVEYWLNNPAYIGKIRWTPDGKTRRDYHNPRSMITEGSHEPLIGAKTWDAAQRRMKEQKERCGKWYKSPQNMSHWLVGLVRCGICGAAMVNCSGYFYCSRRSKGTCGGNGGVKAHTLGDAVIGVLEQLEQPDVSYKIKTPKCADNCASLYEAQLRRAQLRLKRVKEAYESGVDTLEEYRESKSAIQREIEVITAEIRGDSGKNNNSSDIKPRRVLEILRDPSSKTEDKNKAVREFIEMIIKTGDDGRDFHIVLRK